jgi:lipoprotein signal peptidase
LIHVIAASVIFVDQLSKAYSSGGVVNTGISFGLFSSRGLSSLAFVLIPLVLLVFLWKALKHHPIPLGLLMGGAISNVLDRVLNGGVRDWLIVPILGLRNNLADWAILVAIAWYGIIELHHERTRPNS